MTMSGNNKGGKVIQLGGMGAPAAVPKPQGKAPRAAVAKKGLAAPPSQQAI